MKVYIYVTKAKPYLCYQDCESTVKSRNFKGYKLFDASYKECSCNGKVVASFELSNIQELDFVMDEGTRNFYIADGFPISEMQKILKQSCLSNNEMLAYGKGKPLFALRIDDLEILKKPIMISDFVASKIRANPKLTDVWPITKAPQSWCRSVGRGAIYTNEGYFDGFTIQEDSVILSVQSKWACKILNGEKTVEIRHNAPKGI